MHFLLLFSKQKWKIHHALAVSPELRGSYAAVAVAVRKKEGRVFGAENPISPEPHPSALLIQPHLPTSFTDVTGLDWLFSIPKLGFYICLIVIKMNEVAKSYRNKTVNITLSV